MPSSDGAMRRIVVVSVTVSTGIRPDKGASGEVLQPFNGVGGTPEIAKCDFELMDVRDFFECDDIIAVVARL